MTMSFDEDLSLEYVVDSLNSAFEGPPFEFCPCWFDETLGVSFEEYVRNINDRDA